jgi:hypothetical protein
MNKTFWLAVLAATPLLAQTSENQPTSTKIEAFSQRVGAVIVKGYKPLGVLGDATGTVGLECREFFDPATNKREYGLIVQVTEKAGRERESLSYVDYEEIDELLRGIDYISTIDSSVTKLGNFEALYRTKDNLQIAVFSSQGHKQAAVMSGQSSPVTVFITRDDLAKLRVWIADAKLRLDALRNE